MFCLLESEQRMRKKNRPFARAKLSYKFEVKKVIYNGTSTVEK